VLGVSAYLNNFIARYLGEFVSNTLFAWGRMIKALTKKRQLRVGVSHKAQSKDSAASAKVSSYCVIFVMNEIASIGFCESSPK
jgi:hypothetical protein